MADNWSKAELAVAVKTYLWMFGEEKAGRSYVKSHVMSEAQTKLPNRKLSDFRMQNISSVLENLGQSWIDGYKPRPNVGVNVSNLIEELLDELGYWESDLSEETFQASTSWVYPREGSGKWTITEEGIYKAIDEFREKGRETFLMEYGFGESTTYKLLFDGELFDPKAIVGVAHKWSEDASSPLTHKQLSGGNDRGYANWCLSELGFQIVEIKTVTKSAGRAREIQVEKNKAEEFLISGRKEGRGERNEARLQEEYKKYLESFGHETCSWELSSENRTSYVDLFDKTTNELCEAKSSAEHAYVWKAIGQVLYYAHLLKPEITVYTVSVLLPSLPEKELLELMHELGIVCVYKKDDSFERIEPG